MLHCRAGVRLLLRPVEGRHEVVEELLGILLLAQREAPHEQVREDVVWAQGVPVPDATRVVRVEKVLRQGARRVQ